eukprot:6651635-Alexandrium_andersonii.AAC.1
MPFDRGGVLPPPVPVGVRPRRLRKNDKREQWRKFADRYEETHSQAVHKSRGVRYIRDLADGLLGAGD